jgi:hypothetical protein
MNQFKKRIACLLLAGVGLFSPLLVVAESQTTTLEELLARALDESPLVKRIAAHTTQSRALGIETSTLENPTLDSEIRFPTSRGDSKGQNEIALALSQPMRVSDFGTRARINELIQSAASQDERAELLAFSQRFRLAYVKSWSLSQRADEMQGSLARISKIEKHVNAAAQGGFILPSERALFKAEALKARYQLRALSADLIRARAELAKLAGFAVGEKLTPPTFAVLPSEAELLEREERLPAQTRAKLALQLATEQMKRAELDAYP